MLIGDNKKFVSALIVPSFGKLKEWAKHHGIEYGSNEAIVKNTMVITMIEAIVEEYNQLFNQVEQVKRFALLPREWNVESGEMTPKLSIRRKIVLDHFAKEIDALYV